MKRTHASGLSAAIAFVIVSLMFYILTLAVEKDSSEPLNQQNNAAVSGRVSKDAKLTGGEYWLVHFGAYDTKDEAQIQSARFAGRGAAGYTHKDDHLYYAVGNCYEDEAMAKKVCERLAGEGIGADVLSVKQAEITIRISASDEQISAFDEAYKALVQSENALLDIASNLDAGQRASDACAHLSVLAYELKIHAQKMENAVGSRSSLICMKVSGLCQTALSNVKELSNRKDGEMYLASAIRLKALEMRFSRLAFLSSISG